MYLIVYSKPNCVQCVQTMKVLDKNKILYSKVDVTLEQAAYDFITKDLNYSAAPVVVVFDKDNNILDSWSGFNLEKISEIRSKYV